LWGRIGRLDTLRLSLCGTVGRVVRDSVATVHAPIAVQAAMHIGLRRFAITGRSHRDQVQRQRITAAVEL
jgi:hypothetical protein